MQSLYLFLCFWLIGNSRVSFQLTLNVSKKEMAHFASSLESLGGKKTRNNFKSKLDRLFSGVELTGAPNCWFACYRYCVLFLDLNWSSILTSTYVLLLLPLLYSNPDLIGQTITKRRMRDYNDNNNNGSNNNSLWHKLSSTLTRCIENAGEVAIAALAALKEERGMASFLTIVSKFGWFVGRKIQMSP